MGNNGIVVLDISNPIAPTHLDTYEAEFATSVTIDGNYAFIADKACLRIIGIAQPHKVTYVGEYSTQGEIKEIAVIDKYTYIAEGKNLLIIDISDIERPKFAGKYQIGNINFDSFSLFHHNSNNYIVIVDDNNGIVIIDISNPTNPSSIGGIDIHENINDFTVSGNFAYLATGEKYLMPNDNKLVIIDISDPVAPVFSKYIDLQNYAEGITVYENYVYIAEGKDGLEVIDASDLENTYLIGQYVTAGSANAIALSANNAFLAMGEKGLLIIDISNPAKPFLKSWCSTKGIAKGISISGNYAYIANGYNGLQIIDISDPTNPVLKGNCNTHGMAQDIAGSRNYVYIADGYNGIVVIDVSDPANPYCTGWYSIMEDIKRIDILNNYACIVKGVNGIDLIDISDPHDPAFVKNYTIKGDVFDVTQSGGYVYIVSQHVSGGILTIIDISDPLNPLYMSEFEGRGEAYASLVTTGNYAVITSCYNDLYVMNITNPSAPSLAGKLRCRFGVKDIVLSGSYAFIIGQNYDSILQVIDLSNPKAPKFIEEYEGRTEDISVSQDYAVIVNTSQNFKSSVKIIDISNPATPILLSDSRLENKNGYVFDIALSGEYLYLLSSRFEIFDISNPYSPVRKGMCSVNGKNLIISGNYAYVAGWWEGLEVIDISDPSHPFLAGVYSSGGRASDIAITGNYAYISICENYSTTGLEVFDISDQRNPIPVWRYGIEDSTGEIFILGNYLYVCKDSTPIFIYVFDISRPETPSYVGYYGPECWMHEVAVSGSYFYVPSYNSGIRVYDLFDPIHPNFVGIYYTPGSAKDITISGNYAYVADNDGLVIIDISSPIPSHIGGYDIEVKPITFELFVLEGLNGTGLTDSIIFGLGPSYLFEPKEGPWDANTLRMYLMQNPWVPDSPIGDTEILDIDTEALEAFKWYITIDRGMMNVYPQLHWDSNDFDPGNFQLQRGWEEDGEIIVWDMSSVASYEAQRRDGGEIMRFALLWSLYEPIPHKPVRPPQATLPLPYLTYPYPYHLDPQYVQFLLSCRYGKKGYTSFAGLSVQTHPVWQSPYVYPYDIGWNRNLNIFDREYYTLYHQRVYDWDWRSYGENLYSQYRIYNWDICHAQAGNFFSTGYALYNNNSLYCPLLKYHH